MSDKTKGLPMESTMGPAKPKGSLKSTTLQATDPRSLLTPKPKPAPTPKPKPAPAVAGG